MKKQTLAQKLVIFLIAMVGLSGTVVAQEGSMVEPLDLSNEPVVVEFNADSAGPPTIEPLTDGRMTFRVAAAGEVSGTLQGSISIRVSEVTPMPSPAFHAVSVMFTIETEDGVIEGYYAGSFHRSAEGDVANINASGLILSVSGVYADLYLAEVFVTSAVQFVDGRAVGESGTMTIAAR
jgi:hypothetical protein